MIDNVDINKIQKELLEEDTIIDIAELFKVFADSTRVKIINVLLENKLCVSDIATLVGGTQSAISHQLRILKSAKLVKYTKIGKPKTPQIKFEGLSISFCHSELVSASLFRF